MPEFKVLVSEHVTHTFIVTADSQDEAEEIVEDEDSELEPVKSATTSWFVVMTLDADSQVA